MSTSKTYGGVIWTNHAIQRLHERNIKQSDAWATWRNPDHSRYAESQGGWVYSRKVHKEIIEVVAKQNEKKEWLILSVWSKPSYGEYNRPVERSFFARVKNLLSRFF